MVCVVPYNSTTYLTCKVSASRAQNKMKKMFFSFFMSRRSLTSAPVKVSASRAKCQIYLSISETPPNFGPSQRGASRAKCQIYLSISETPPPIKHAYKTRPRVKEFEKMITFVLSYSKNSY